jgi:hypothetical protein
MKHAGPEALDTIEPLLRELRAVPFLVEMKRGVFYRGSRAFLHFHQDSSGLHADVRVGQDFDTYRVETKSERATFLALVRRS